MTSEANLVQPGSPVSPSAEERVLGVTRDLLLEIHHQQRKFPPITPDSRFDSDLGFDSLTRAELLLRLERSFDIELPDSLIAEANTPRDLMHALQSHAHGQGRRLQKATRETVTGTAIDEPFASRTLIEVLTTHAEAHSDRIHLNLWQSDEAMQAVTYGELLTAAMSIAGGLLARDLEPGDRVGIMLPTCTEFFFTFCGVLWAGGVPVPIYPPARQKQLEEHIRRQGKILHNAGARILIGNEQVRPVSALLKGIVESIHHVVTVDELRQDVALSAPVPVGPESSALIQYTSGSTGDPKGVSLSHSNLLSNIRAMGQHIGATSSDVFVSWLPLYHDMGLIGAWLGSLYYGVTAVFMPPLAFLAKPARWFWLMHRYRATLTAAPNFAFERCLTTIRESDIEGLDLSSMRFVANGAEPIHPDTLRRFMDRFAAYGFPRVAMAPVYGLAENSVGLVMPPLGREPIIERIDRETFSRLGHAEPAKPDDPAPLEFVCCGQALPGHEIRIVDDTGHEAPERQQGRLQFRGPSATSGYFDNEEKTKALYSGDWLESGDLAFVASGEVYLTGRVKDLIIRAGRNIYPQELEEAISAVPGVHKGCVAAFATKDERSGTEQLVVIAETRLRDSGEREALYGRIQAATQALIETKIDDIVLAPPRSVPKTSSGKIRRSAARDLYRLGALHRSSRALWWQVARLRVSAIVHQVRRITSLISEWAYAAYWWLVLSLIAAAVWLTIVLLPSQTIQQKVLRQAARLFFFMTATPVTVSRGTEIPATGVMFAVNHASYIDAAALLVAIPGTLVFVAKEEFTRQFFAGTFLRRIGTLFVRRTDVAGGLEDTATMLTSAQEGARIVAFPEGTFTRSPGLMKFHMGTFIVATEANVPIVPVSLSGTRSILRGSQWLPRRGSIFVTVGEPIPCPGQGFSAAVDFRDTVRAEILKHCGEPDIA